MKAVWGVAYKVACGVCLVWLAVVLGVAVHYGWRALVADTFVIPSDSMSPTLLPGDKVSGLHDSTSPTTSHARKYAERSVLCCTLCSG